MHEAEIHHHRRSNEEMYGQQLRPGDVIEADDRIDNRVASWWKCGPSLTGSVMRETYGKVIIVRPLPVMTFGAV